MIRKAWHWLLAVGPLTAAALFTAGIIFWGGFNWSFEVTNTEQFCISCHEMKQNVFREYQHTVHYTNRSGVRATCPDCHVPKEWGPKIVRKIQASNELLHKVLGSIDTPEKFQAKRLKLAESEWARMKANDSQECRNCHKYEYMDLAEQGRRAVRTHSVAFSSGQTCIDCHKGIAHQLPPTSQEIGAPKPASTSGAPFEGAAKKP
jgi:cytochrome c-type protein NapC